MNPTPTPWTILQDGHGGYIGYVAALIVRAVNAHAELVAALTAVCDSFEQHANGLDVIRVYHQARAALARARGEAAP